MKRIVSLLMLLIVISQMEAQKLPRIIILATGGTIAGAGTSSDRAGYTAGKIPIEDLIGTIPTVKKVADITGEQIASVGSQDMTVDIWKKLAIRYQRN
jgi:L-asparaginase